MSAVEQLTTKLTAIADAIREKNGLPWTMSIDEMPVAIRNLESGEESEDTPIIENSFTVNYHNADNELIESHTVLCGHEVPDCIALETYYWVDENELVVSVPVLSLTPAIFNLFPRNSETYKRFYSLYEINESDYPYLLVGIRSSEGSTGTKYYAAVCFSCRPFYVEFDNETATNFRIESTTTGDTINVNLATISEMPNINYNSHEEVYDWFAENIGAVSYQSLSNWNFGRTSPTELLYVYGNQIDLSENQYYEYIG